MAGLLPAIAIPAVRRRLAQAVELTELAASRPACAALMRNGASGAFPLQPGQHTADIDRRVPRRRRVLHG